MTPETFQHELTVRLGPRYRLRRAITAPRWRVEQKVARQHDYPANSDRQLMLREGYHLVLDSPDTDTTRCPKCDSLLALPVFERHEMVCPKCASIGVRSRIVDGYFPLVDKTLLYLERYSPRRGFAWHEEDERANRMLKKSQARDSRNVAEDLALDAWQRIAGVPQFGRTKAGTPHTWGAD